MKARLIARRMPPEVINPTSQVYALDPNAPIPEGWEELEIVSGFASPQREEPLSTDFCAEVGCAHKRSHHASYRHECLKLGCKCKRFREAG